MLLYRRDQRSMIYGIFCAFRYATRAARDFGENPLVIVEHARLFFFFLFFLFSFKEFLEITGAPRARARLITQRSLPMFFFSSFPYLSANNKYLIDRRLYVALQ